MSGSQDIKAKLLEILSLMNANEINDILSGLQTASVADVDQYLEKQVKRSNSVVVDDKFRVVRSDEALGSQKTPVKASQNSWSDPGEFKDDSFDPTKFNKTPRERKPPAKVSKNCSICGKAFKIQESLIYGTVIRCDRCTGR